eukprot:jgi/Galph1/896/GphlegSOOS_G5662.1
MTSGIAGRVANIFLSPAVCKLVLWSQQKRLFYQFVKCHRESFVVGCGSNVVDYFFKVKRFPASGSKGYLSCDVNGPEHNSQSTFDRLSSYSSVGGVTLNHLSWASLLGTPCCLLAAQGEDTTGTRIRTVAQQLGLSLEGVILSPSYQSSSCLVFYDSTGERSILMSPGSTSLINAEFVKQYFAPIISKACMLTSEISQVPLSGVLCLLRDASSQQIPTVLDVDIPLSSACDEQDANLGAKTEFFDCLNGATVVKISLSVVEELISYQGLWKGELSLFHDTSAILQISKLLCKELQSAELVIITMGKDGSVIANKQHSIQVPSRNIFPIVDTTGAGDAYLGGIVTGLYHLGFPESEKDLHLFGELATTCASLCCSAIGALPLPQQEFRQLLVGHFPSSLESILVSHSSKDDVSG